MYFHLDHCQLARNVVRKANKVGRTASPSNKDNIGSGDTPASRHVAAARCTTEDRPVDPETAPSSAVCKRVTAVEELAWRRQQDDPSWHRGAGQVVMGKDGTGWEGVERWPFEKTKKRSRGNTQNRRASAASNVSQHRAGRNRHHSKSKNAQADTYDRPTVTWAA